MAIIFASKLNQLSLLAPLPGGNLPQISVGRLFHLIYIAPILIQSKLLVILLPGVQTVISILPSAIIPLNVRIHWTILLYIKKTLTT